MEKVKTTVFDPIDYLEDEEDIDLYLDEAFKTNDPDFILLCMNDVARARGMAKIAEEAGISNANSSPSFAVILKLLDSLGLALTTKTKVPT